MAKCASYVSYKTKDQGRRGWLLKGNLGSVAKGTIRSMVLTLPSRVLSSRLEREGGEGVAKERKRVKTS